MQSEFTDVPKGKIAAVVTHLQMFERPPKRAVHVEGLQLVHYARPDLAWYRDLFMRVGGQDWMWFGRLALNDADLSAALNAQPVQVYSLQVDGRDEGLLELEFSENAECELRYFGLTASMVGTGAGRWLMEQALDLAWAQPITRFHVHTCTLDSPQAVPFYLRSGFTAHLRQIEIVDDPRLIGVLPRDASPQTPII